MMKAFSNFIIRRAGIIAVLGTLLGVAGGYYSIQLYKNLRTELQELLPTTARSVVDLREVSTRLESVDSLAVLIFSDHPRKSKKFVIDLVKKLDQAPKSIIASVDYKIDEELKFFRARQALFIDLPDLIRVRNFIRDRIEYETALYNPLNIFSGEELPEPELDFLAIKSKYTGKTSNYERLPAGYYATPDEKKRAIIVNMPGQSGGIENAHRLKNAVLQAISELQPHSYAPDLQIKFTGVVEDSIEEQGPSFALFSFSFSAMITALCRDFGRITSGER